MGRIVRAARNRGIRRLYMSCLAENSKMQAIARKHEADLRFEYGEVIGEILPGHAQLFLDPGRSRRGPCRLHDRRAGAAEPDGASGLSAEEALARFLRSTSPSQANMPEEEDVQGPFDPKRNVPLIDLGTVRDTLAYIRDDFQRVPAWRGRRS